MAFIDLFSHIQCSTDVPKIIVVACYEPACDGISAKIVVSIENCADEDQITLEHMYWVDTNNNNRFMLFNDLITFPRTISAGKHFWRYFLRSILILVWFCRQFSWVSRSIQQICSGPTIPVTHTFQVSRPPIGDEVRLSRNEQTHHVSKSIMLNFSIQTIWYGRMDRSSYDMVFFLDWIMRQHIHVCFHQNEWLRPTLTYTFK